MTRVMSIWFPQLPLDLWVRRDDPRLSGPFAITRDIKNAMRLTHMNNLAIQAGLVSGVSLADAMTICPGLLSEKYDADRSSLLHRALWRWADRFSPWIALDGEDGLFLNITGCAHLFGGEASMAEQALIELGDLNVTARIGMADTKQAAWALARFSGQSVSAIAPGDLSKGLENLPVAALNIKDKLITALRRTGLKRIGDLYKYKTAELARRFGLELTQRLSAALGYMSDPVSPQAADPVYAARMSLPDPIGLLGDIESVLGRLTASICTRLERDQMGARRFDLIIRCPDKDHHHLSIGFARPCYEAGAVLQQFSRPLNDLKLAFGADFFRLVADHLEPLKPRQSILGGELQVQEEDFDQLISTLGNRLGFDRIRRLIARDYNLPDLAFSSVEAVSDIKSQWEDAPAAQNNPPRPFRLYPFPERLRTLESGRPPKRFEWRRNAYDLAHVTGPERLAPPWWEGHDHHMRDYWTVQTRQGPRLWLMTYPGANRPDWFIAGQFV